MPGPTMSVLYTHICCAICVGCCLALATLSNCSQHQLSKLPAAALTQCAEALLHRHALCLAAYEQTEAAGAQDGTDLA
jgi:hypothetical protein